MSDEMKSVLHRWFEEVWNKGREEAIDELFAEDGIAHGLGALMYVGSFEHAARKTRSGRRIRRPPGDSRHSVTRRAFAVVRVLGTNCYSVACSSKCADRFATTTC